MALVTVLKTEKAKAVVALATIRTNSVRAGPSAALRFAQDDIALGEGIGYGVGGVVMLKMKKPQ